MGLLDVMAVVACLGRPLQLGGDVEAVFYRLRVEVGVFRLSTAAASCPLAGGLTACLAEEAILAASGEIGWMTGRPWMPQGDFFEVDEVLALPALGVLQSIH